MIFGIEKEHIARISFLFGNIALSYDSIITVLPLFLFLGKMQELD